MTAFRYASIDEAVASLPLEQKVGQLFQVGFDATTPTEDLLDLLDRGVGAVIYFDRNVASSARLADLSNRLQDRAVAATGLPLLLSIDQEGGLVTRLGMSDAIPSPMAIAAAGDAALAERAGATVGRQLRRAGVTMNLAPVCDVAGRPTARAIARSYGSDPDRVGELAAATVRGLQSAVVATAKHFPGGGASPSDAHFSLPTVEHDRERLDAVELPPFEAAIDAGVDAIMVGHTAFSALGPADRPASTAAGVVTDLLRKRLGYDGVVMTDCMEMDAVAETVGTAAGAVQAIEAGVDIVLVSHTPARQRAAIDAVRDAVATGRLSEARIDCSLRRVLSAKAGLVADEDTGRRTDSDERGRLARRIARAAVTTIRDPGERLPPPSERLVLLTGSAEPLSPAEEAIGYADRLQVALEDRGVGVRRPALSDPAIGPGPAESIVVCTHDAVRNDDQVAAVDRLEAEGHDPVVLAVHNPYDAAVLPDATTVLTTYEYSPPMIAAAADALAGSLTPSGTVPVSLSRVGDGQNPGA